MSPDRGNTYAARRRSTPGHLQRTPNRAMRTTSRDSSPTCPTSNHFRGQKASAARRNYAVSGCYVLLLHCEVHQQSQITTALCLSHSAITCSSA